MKFFSFRTRLLALIFLVLLSPDLAMAEDTRYFEFGLTVPHESAGELSVGGMSLEVGKFSGSNISHGDISVRLLDGRGVILDKEYFDSDYSVNAAESKSDNSSGFEPARRVEEFIVRLNYSSSADSVDVYRNDELVQRIDVQSEFCDVNGNLSICRDRGVGDASEPAFSGWRFGLFAAVLAVILLYFFAENHNYRRSENLGDFS